MTISIDFFRGSKGLGVLPPQRNDANNQKNMARFRSFSFNVLGTKIRALKRHGPRFSHTVDEYMLNTLICNMREKVILKDCVLEKKLNWLVLTTLTLLLICSSFNMWKMAIQAAHECSLLSAYKLVPGKCGFLAFQLSACENFFL